MNAYVGWTILKEHSDRVPGKNFRALAGRPLFRWILDAVDAVPEIERIVINTDARARLLAQGVAESPRLSLRERPTGLRGAHVSANELLAADLPILPGEHFVMVHATSPFVRPDTIRRALAAFEEGVARGDGDSLFAVRRHQARFYRADGSPVNHDPARLVPTQTLEPWYEETSALYVFSRRSFAATGSRIGARPILFEVPKWESLDIDDEDDWALAERVAAGLGAAAPAPIP